MTLSRVTPGFFSSRETSALLVGLAVVMYPL